MPSIILYLLKCSISLAIVWLFYQLLLRRLTFYMMNRWYLLGYAFLSFLLPLIHIALPVEETVTGKVQIIRYIPVIAGSPAARATVAFRGWDIVLFVLSLGALLLLGRLLIRWLSLGRLRKGAQLIRDGEVSVYEVDQQIIPFSFGNAIYINPRLHLEKEWEEIILHEYVHVRQKHTLDILLAELFIIVNWYNPFVWLIRYSIRQNLEFIADRQVLATGRDKKSYQYHLLKVIGESRYRLANNFNFSSLKKRIIMMNRTKSARLHLLRFLFIVPLLGVLLVAFRDKVDIHLPVRSISPVIRDTTPTQPSDMVITLRKGTPDSVKPMIIIDEVEATEADLHKLDPVSISSVNVMKVATHDFGTRARGGVVFVLTKQYAPTRKNEVLLKDGKRVRLAVAEPPSVSVQSDVLPKVNVDTEHGNQGVLTGVNDYTIDSVRVGNNIYSGHVRGMVFSDTTQPLSYKDDPATQLLREALIIVDGKPCAYENLKLSPDRIASMEILKNEAAIATYGPKAKNGVILITTKEVVTVSVSSGTIDKVNVKADSLIMKK